MLAAVTIILVTSTTLVRCGFFILSFISLSCRCSSLAFPWLTCLSHR
jgi:hypothetical protein